MTRSMFSATRRRVLYMGLAIAGVALQSGPLHAQTFPDKRITFLVPYSPGGVTDAMVRAVAEVASKELGQPIVILNKPGAGGVIGAAEVARAKPDGYTILLAGSGSLMVSTALRTQPPFDPLTSFTPLAGNVDFAAYLFVSPDFPAKTAQEFVDYVRANPGKVAYATPHNQSLLQMADFARTYGLDMVQVDYKAETAAAIDLATDRVQAMFATSTPLTLAQEGKIRVLATSMAKRVPLTPDVPTLTESGTPAAPFGGGFLAVYGPSNLPEPVARRLGEALDAGFKAPSTQEVLHAAGLVYNPLTKPEDLAKYNREQRDTYAKLIDEIGLPKQ